MISARTILAAVVVCGLLLVFAGDGIRAYFTPDDVMNLYVSWSAAPAELLHNDRPVGALVYRGMFDIFGLHPLPYRVLGFALLLVNLALLYRFAERLTGSREAAALCCLVGAYHAHLADLYYSTGTIYDLLCFLFFLLAFNWYLRIRETGYPSWRQTAGLVALYGCALGSKEMAVALPLYVALYEVIFYSGKWRGVFGVRFLWIAVPLTAAYAAMKVAGPHAMSVNPAYAPHLSLHVFLTAWRAYLGDLFYGAIAFNTFKVAAVWAILLVGALVGKRRELLFAWCMIMAGVLPFIFIAPRGFFVMYLTLPGWYLYAAVALMSARDFVMRQVPRWSEALAVRPEQLALFTIVALLLIPLHRREKPLGDSWVAGSHQQVRAVLGKLAADYPSMPRGGKVLFLKDPYDADDWILRSMLRLEYRDKELRVDRVKEDPALAGHESEYAHVFVLDEGGLKEVKP
jgi:hypothetical protein